MNKLAALALALLLFFGGALWYLANSEFNTNVQARIIQVSNYYTEQEISIDKVEINLVEGTGEIYGLKLKNQTKYQHKYMLTIAQVSFTFDSKSLTAKVIKLNEIVLKEALFFIEDNPSAQKKNQNNFSELYQLLNEKIALIRDRRKQKTEAYLQVANVKLINVEQILLPATTIQNNNSTKSQKINLAAIGTGDGLPASLFGIEVLRKTLEAIMQINAEK